MTRGKGDFNPIVILYVHPLLKKLKVKQGVDGQMNNIKPKFSGDIRSTLD